MSLYCFQLCRRLSLKTAGAVKSERAQPERGARRARRAERDARTPSKAVRPCTHPTPEKGTARVCERNELSSCNFTREPQLSAALNVTQVQGGTTPGQGQHHIALHPPRWRKAPRSSTAASPRTAATRRAAATSRVTRISPARPRCRSIAARSTWCTSEVPRTTFGCRPRGLNQNFCFAIGGCCEAGKAMHVPRGTFGVSVALACCTWYHANQRVCIRYHSGLGRLGYDIEYLGPRVVDLWASMTNRKAYVPRTVRQQFTTK